MLQKAAPAFPLGAINISRDFDGTKFKGPKGEGEMSTFMAAVEYAAYN